MKLRTATLLLIAAFVVAFSASAVAGTITGAIYTTTKDGQKVNYNIYDAKSDVYLNGGPQNTNSAGLPDGTYYFQVTQPPAGGHNEVLLSVDAITCRQVRVAGGVFVGPIGDCEHNAGDANPANGSTSVQLCAPSGCAPANPDFLDTGNAGGEYKVWITNVNDYKPADNGVYPVCGGGHASVFGFCPSLSKTDNFKVKKQKTTVCDPNAGTCPPCDPNSGTCPPPCDPNAGTCPPPCDPNTSSCCDPDCGTTQPPPPATVTACKFNDVDRDGSHGGDEPLLDGWTIHATGVDGDSGSGVEQSTVDGCTTFTYTFNVGETQQQVTLAEVQQTGWTQSAPLDGQGNVILTQNVTLNPGDNVITPDFGNYLPAFAPTGSKTAPGTFNQPYSWGITKRVDKTLVEQSGGSATFNYTVSVTRTTGTINGISIAGVISVFNGNAVVDQNNNTTYLPITIDSITDVLSDSAGTCSVTGTFPATLTQAQTDFPYSCSISGSAVPSGEINNATISWSGQLLSNGGSFLGGTAAPSAAVTYTQNSVDNCVTVTDPLDPNTGHYTCANATYTYSKTVSAPAGGQCTTVNNTATYTTNTTPLTGSASQTVNLCNTRTGALTMGFWQGPNGQKTIGTSKTGTCPAYTLLTSFAPFADLVSTTKQSCADVNTYVGKVVNGANSSGGGALMLKGQMMATILTVNYGNVAGQGTVLNLGGIWILLNPIKGTEDVRNAFGSALSSPTYNTVAPHLWGETVGNMILTANANYIASGCAATSDVCGGPGVYKNKTALVLASDAFAFINQAQANISAP